MSDGYPRPLETYSGLLKLRYPLCALRYAIFYVRTVDYDLKACKVEGMIFFVMQTTG
jgi:hypothetical protein